MYCELIKENTPILRSTFSNLAFFFPKLALAGQFSACFVDIINVFSLTCGLLEYKNNNKAIYKRMSAEKQLRL